MTLVGLLLLLIVGAVCGAVAEMLVGFSPGGFFASAVVGFLGAWIGTYISGRVVDYYTTAGIRDWRSSWLTFAGYALILGITFPLVFRYKHNPESTTTAFQQRASTNNCSCCHNARNNCGLHHSSA